MALRLSISVAQPNGAGGFLRRLSRFGPLQFLQWQPSGTRTRHSAPHRPTAQTIAPPRRGAPPRCATTPFFRLIATKSLTPASTCFAPTVFRITTRCRFAWRSNFPTGLQFEASYTYAHALDDASSAALGSLNNGDFRDQRYPYLEYGNSDFDVRHRFVISYIYQFPFGNGKRFSGDATGLKNQIIGNWQIAGITTASTGNWFTITDAATNVSSSDGGGGVSYF
jgi:hypothetical protein